MSSIKLNVNQFIKRLRHVQSVLDKPLIIMLGKPQDVEYFGLNSAMFLYLLDYEFPETILIIGRECKAITSQKKAEILSQISEINTIVRQKDGSDTEKIISDMDGDYYIIDRDNIKGILCDEVLKRVKWTDATEKITPLFLFKDKNEENKCTSAAAAASNLLEKASDMIWEDSFNPQTLEEMLGDKMKDIDNSQLELSFPIEYTRNTVRIGVRFAGYCAEIGRTYITNMDKIYKAQDYILNLIKPGASSEFVYNKAKEYLDNNGISATENFLYTTGLIIKEQSFKKNFELENSVVFVINLSTESILFSNTFILQEEPKYLTSQDEASDFYETRPRFRNKTKEYELSARRKEHQKYLLEKLIEEQLEHYKNQNTAGEEQDHEEIKKVSYSKEGQIPRVGRAYVDIPKESVLIPLGSYMIPFHISLIKTASVVDEIVLKVTFKNAAKEKGTTDPDESLKGSLSSIKSINIKGGYVRDVLNDIYTLKKIFESKEDTDIVEQEELKLRNRPHVLNDVFMRTDVKTGSRKKKASNLEIHENGFRFPEENVDVLYSNIKHVFFIEGQVENKTLLHFHLINPILLGKKTKNIQFYQEASVNSTYDTMKRADEHMEYLLEKEEKEKQKKINAQFKEFIAKFEQETNFTVQLPTDGFYGVPYKENVMIQQTHECLVSLEEVPFFVLTLEDVEIVNFERMVFSVKTSDIVFIFKDKSIAPVHILNIDVQKINKFKDYLDSNNILFMETTVNIQWTNLIKTIMKDPISFYENGAWSELMMEEGVEEASEQESEISEESTVSEEDIGTDDDDDVSDVSSEEISVNEDDDDYVSIDESEEFDDETDESSYEERAKKRRKR